jgi:integrase
MEVSMKIRRKKSAKKPGRKVGQMRPFTQQNIEMLENLLKADDCTTSIRDLALLRIGLDTMLRSVDLTSLTVENMSRDGKALPKIVLQQKKTKRTVECVLLPKTREALEAWLEHAELTDVTARIFAISTRQYQRRVKEWCDMIKIDGTMFSTHSIRRTKPTILYAKTKNIVAIKELLGHSNPSATHLYLGVTRDDAFAMALECDV